MEAKTITVTLKTHKELESLKENMGASSFDQLLSQLAEEKIQVRQSMFGAAKGLRESFSRDRKDRI
ncbi:hypothetical protein HYU14_05430 [Candidatus Woesearchaeota archaeon]|nr:hypothetical protein [Candidatus Woesearchaeota archaeon]